MLLEEFPRTSSTRELSTCGAVMLEDGPIHWRVWAPQAESVQLVLVAEDDDALGAGLLTPPEWTTEGLLRTGDLRSVECRGQETATQRMGNRGEFPMERELSGYFVQQLDGTGEGQRYGFRLNDGPLRPDPASRSQPDGVHRPSAVFCPEHFFWTDQDWHGVPRDELVIYELHDGTFTP